MTSAGVHLVLVRVSDIRVEIANCVDENLSNNTLSSVLRLEEGGGARSGPGTEGVEVWGVREVYA